MRRKTMAPVAFLCAVVLVAGVARLPAQALHAASSASVSPDSLKFLVGRWVGEGTAETGQPGEGYCTFEPGLQGTALVRKNHSEYPATKDHPAIVHDDLMIIYPDHAKAQLRSFYTDNEGNVIHYTVAPAPDGKSAVFLGDAEPGARRYRLTYTVTEPGRMTVTFEMAPPATPDQFQKFIEGKLRLASPAK